jgi:FtsP/CotA-like multicopper oxidase with cupredoxin domain
MEQFNDTPIVNGVAYPTLTLEPKTYRFRVLSAANDRFFNFQWYVADPTTASTALNANGDIIGGTEVAFNQAELAAAQLDPVVFPTPDLALSPAGPDWVQIGTEGGFLPAPVVVDGQQVTTWITDPTRFDVGNVDLHSLLLAPAERADVIVDFSRFAGQTLILYNDAPAAFPARVPSYDYYTGGPDLSPNGAPAVLPGYGPNTRTIMQVKIAAAPVAPAFNFTSLRNAFSHKANGSGVFESSQHPIIVGQAAYNSAYGTNFAASGRCTETSGTSCDGYVRVNDYASTTFNTLRNPRTLPMTLPLQPKAIHDEMNASTFDEFGRMQANLGVEAQPPIPGAQNVVLYPFVNPATELIDATNLPRAVVTFDTVTGLPVSDVKITPISDPGDGTQIWRITHNGVDTHPIHFHLYDVQVVNRVTWDNIIIPPDLTELGWKDTVRMAPLEDTIVALRPIIPQLPWELPNSVHNLSPMMPTGSTAMFNNIDANGNPTAAIINDLVNFGWEYVYHCHILSHEEMDMMRPVSVAMPPIAPDGLVFNVVTQTLSWNDNSINETEFVVQKSSDGSIWNDVSGGTILSPLNQPNIHEPRTLTDSTYTPLTGLQYRVVAKNTIGYGGAFMSMTAQSVSAPLIVTLPAVPVAPILTADLLAGQVVLSWNDVALEDGYVIERSDNLGVTWSQVGQTAVDVLTFVDTSVSPLTVYGYRVYAFNLAGPSLPSIVVQVTTLDGPPAAPSNLSAVNVTQVSLTLLWQDNSNNETGFTVQVASDSGFTNILQTNTAGANVTTWDFNGLTAGTPYYFRVQAFTAVDISAWSAPLAVTTSPATIPLAPSLLTTTGNTQTSITLNWVDNSNNETGFTVQIATNNAFTNNLQTLTAGANATSSNFTGLTRNTKYYFRVLAFNVAGSSAWAEAINAKTLR